MKKKDSMLRRFCRHVYNPLEYLVVLIILLICMIGMMLTVVIICYAPVDENDCDRFELTFSDWQTQEDTLILTSPQMDEAFYLYGYETYMTNPEQLMAKCDGETTFSVWAKKVSPKKESPYYIIHAIQADGQTYQTFADSTEQRRDDIPRTVGMMSIFFAVLLVLAAFIFIVGSNPHKFPKWVVYGCFKKNAIDI